MRLSPLSLITALLLSAALFGEPLITTAQGRPNTNAPLSRPVAIKQQSTKPTSKTSKSTTKAAAGTTAAPVTTSGGSTEPVSEPAGASNPNDSLVNNDVLNLSDPACGLSGMTVSQASRCLRTGDPSVPYPLGDYQMDIHMSTGVTHPINDVFTVLESVMNVIWLLLLYILKGALTLLGWAFSLTPFTNTATLGNVQSKLESVFASLDGIWLDSVFVAIGGYATYLAFVRRRQSEAIGHLGASVAAILIAIAIIHEPQTFIGKPASFVNSFAQDAVSSANLAAHNQTGTVPASKLASLTADLFDTFASGPFCALETNDVKWCLSPPSALEMKAVQRAVQGDHSYEKQAKAIAADVAGRLPAKQQSSAYKAVYGALTSSAPPARRADLFLRYPPGSTPRETLYALYTGENLAGKSPLGEAISSIISGAKSILKDASKADLLAVAGDIIGTEAKVAWDVLKFGWDAITSPVRDIFGGGSSKPKPLAPNKVAIQGSGGLVQRCLVLILTVLALIGVLLVLVWLALHLVSQALLGFVLLFATPIMMFAPAFGVSGRKAFAGWGKTLLGAIASKAFYAAFLGVFILALTALQEASTAALGPSVHASAGAILSVPIKGIEVGKGALLEPEGGSGAGGWGVPWVMQCLLCWAVFFKRNKIVGFFAIDPGAHQQSGSGSMTAMRVMGAAYAAHRLGGVVTGAAKRPINAYRARSMDREMGREQATRDLANDELESQELGVAGRSHDHNQQRAGMYRHALERTDQQIARLKQNPEYRKHAAFTESQATYDKLRASGHKWATQPKPEGNPSEQRRGAEMATKIAKLEAGRSTLKDRHSKAQAVVDMGERNLHAHGQLLSPPELQNRVESRRASLERDKGNPTAWKRAENLELASGKLLTPQRVSNLEQRAQHGDKAAQRELGSIKSQVQARMGVSERLLQGVPVSNRFDRNTAASNPAKAGDVFEQTGRKAELDSRAETRRKELRTQHRRTRLYRG